MDNIFLERFGTFDWGEKIKLRREKGKVGKFLFTGGYYNFSLPYFFPHIFIICDPHSLKQK